MHNDLSCGFKIASILQTLFSLAEVSQLQVISIQLKIEGIDLVFHFYCKYYSSATSKTKYVRMNM